MKVKFLKEADTMSYGFVQKDEEKEVSKADGDAFILRGIAKKITTKKEKD